MTIPIPTNSEIYFKQYLKIINIFNKNKLTENEMNVVAEMNKVLYSLIKDGNPVPTALKLLLDYDNMITMCNKLSLSEVYWRNILTSLRRKNVLKGKTLSKTFIIPIVNEINLQFFQQRQPNNNIPVLRDINEGDTQEQSSGTPETSEVIQ